MGLTMLNSTIAGRLTSVPGVAPHSLAASDRPALIRRSPANRLFHVKLVWASSHEATDAGRQRHRTGFSRRWHRPPPGQPFHV